MLITLQSNNDSDAANFSNHFRQNVIIPKDSKVALTDISYKFDSGVTVYANSTFTLQLGTETIDVTVTAGDYTDEQFVDACNLALTTSINASAYRTQRAYPITSQKFTLNTDQVLVLDLSYNPEEWVPLNANVTSTIERQKLVTSNNALMTAGDGIVLKSTLSDSWTDSVFCAGDDITGNAVLWGAAHNVGTPTMNGAVNFRPQQDEGEFLVGFADQIMPVNLSSGTVANIQFARNEFVIYERNSAGTLQAITTAATYDAGDLFNIEVEEIITGGNGEIKYFHKGSPIVISTGSDRYKITNTSQLIPCGGFFSGKIEKELVFESGTYLKTNVIDESSVTITDTGSGYIDGEYCNLTSSTGELSTIKISAPLGSIATFAFLKRGSISAAGETIQIVGLMSGASNGQITTGAAIDSNTISNGGNGYVTGAATFSNGVDGGDINILSVNASGAITDFTWDQRYPNGIDVGNYTVTQNVSTDAVISVNELSANIPSIGDLSYDVIPKGITNEPLVAHTDLLFDPSAIFASLTNTSLQAGKDTMEVKATSRVNNERETSMMLVNIDQFELSSICKDGGVQKAICAVPYGLEHPNASDTSESRDGEYYYRPYNLLYQKLGNKHVVNHNQIQVRLTDPVGSPILQLKHPTTITIDIQ